MALADLHRARFPLARAALGEAARIDPAKKADADRLIEWNDRRSSAAAEAH